MMMIFIASSSFGGGTFTAWKRRSSEAVLLDRLAILRRSRCTNALNLAAAQGQQARMFAASSEPSADPAPTSVCSSSMNTIEFTILHQLLHDPRRSRSSSCPRYFVPATISEKIQRQHALVRQEARHLAVGDLLRQSFSNCQSYPRPARRSAPDYSSSFGIGSGSRGPLRCRAPPADRAPADSPHSPSRSRENSASIDCSPR